MHVCYVKIKTGNKLSLSNCNLKWTMWPKLLWSPIWISIFLHFYETFPNFSPHSWKNNIRFILKTALNPLWNALKNGKYADYEVVVKGKEKNVARWHSMCALWSFLTLNSSALRAGLEPLQSVSSARQLKYIAHWSTS